MQGWRSLVAAAALSFGAAAPVAAGDEATPGVLSDDALLHKYVLSTLGANGALHATLASSLDQIRHSPEEWGTGADGYAKRWVSEFATSAVGNTTKYSVARVLHHDPSFARCKCTGVGPRLRHALIAPLMARTRDGREVLSPATVAGLAAENIIPAATWYPAPHGARDGAVNALSGFMVKAASDVIHEFVKFKPFH